MAMIRAELTWEGKKYAARLTNLEYTYATHIVLLPKMTVLETQEQWSATAGIYTPNKLVSQGQMGEFNFGERDLRVFFSPVDTE